MITSTSLPQPIPVLFLDRQQTDPKPQPGLLVGIYACVTHTRKMFDKNTLESTITSWAIVQTADRFHEVLLQDVSPELKASFDEWRQLLAGVTADFPSESVDVPATPPTQPSSAISAGIEQERDQRLSDAAANWRHYANLLRNALQLMQRAITDISRNSLFLEGLTFSQREFLAAAQTATYRALSPTTEQTPEVTTCDLSTVEPQQQLLRRDGGIEVVQAKQGTAVFLTSGRTVWAATGRASSNACCGLDDIVAILPKVEQPAAAKKAADVDYLQLVSRDADPLTALVSWLQSLSCDAATAIAEHLSHAITELGQLRTAAAEEKPALQQVSAPAGVEAPFITGRLDYQQAVETLVEIYLRHPHLRMEDADLIARLRLGDDPLYEIRKDTSVPILDSMTRILTVKWGDEMREVLLRPAPASVAASLAALDLSLRNGSC